MSEWKDLFMMAISGLIGGMCGVVSFYVSLQVRLARIEAKISHLESLFETQLRNTRDELQRQIDANAVRLDRLENMLFKRPTGDL